MQEDPASLLFLSLYFFSLSLSPTASLRRHTVQGPCSLLLIPPIPVPSPPSFSLCAGEEGEAAECWWVKAGGKAAVYTNWTC